MKVDLVDYLADPLTGHMPRLEVTQQDGNEVLAGVLHFSSGRCAPIVRGIPRFTGEDYSSTFGFQWNSFPATQVDSAAGTSRSMHRFQNEVASRVGPLEGATVLDVGCGAGRFAEAALELGSTVIAVDLSGAVEAAYGNLGRHPRFHVLQADARSLPIAMRKVDGVYSIGVLQHTPNPYLTARSILRGMRAGSWFAFTAYGRGRWTHLNGKYLVRPITRRMSKAALLAGLERLVPLLEPPIRALEPWPSVSALVRFAVPIAVYPSHDYPNHAVRLEESILDTLDMLSPAYDHPLDGERLRVLLSGVASQVTLHSRRPLEISGVI